MGQIFNSTEYTTGLQTIPILYQLKILTTLETRFLKENIREVLSLVIQTFHEPNIGGTFKKKRQISMSNSIDFLFIHKAVNIMGAMMNIFPLSRKTHFPFSFLPKCQHLLHLGKLATQRASH